MPPLLHPYVGRKNDKRESRCPSVSPSRNTPREYADLPKQITASVVKNTRSVVRQRPQGRDKNEKSWDVAERTTKVACVREKPGERGGGGGGVT